MSIGSLPIRYIGILLCTKKLSLPNCEPMLQQVKSRIITWFARSLSFAGRVFLINSVVAGICNLWCSTFVLPKEFITKINSLCNSFLWKGSTEGRYSARVAWKTVTKPKNKGWIGINDLWCWNELVLSDWCGCSSSSMVRYGLRGIERSYFRDV